MANNLIFEAEMLEREAKKKRDVAQSYMPDTKVKKLKTTKKSLNTLET